MTKKLLKKFSPHRFPKSLFENTCPLGAVKVRRGCYAAVEAERYVGCGKCARLCPVGCIEVQARDEA